MKNKTIAFTFALLVACGSDPVPPAPNGEACEIADDCESDMCSTTLGFGDNTLDLPNGLCTQVCDASTNLYCPEGEVCLQYTYGGAVCFQRCGNDEHCREHWQCADVGFFTPVYACVPRLD